MAHETQKTSLLQITGLSQKDTTQQCQTEEMHKARNTGFHTFSRAATSPGPLHIHQPKIPPNFNFRDFYGGLIMQAKSLNHWSLMTKLSRGQDDSTAKQPPPFCDYLGGFPKITWSINSGVVQRSLL